MALDGQESDFRLSFTGKFDAMGILSWSAWHFGNQRLKKKMEAMTSQLTETRLLSC